MEIKKDVVNLEQLKKNPVFQLSLSAKELFHSNFLYWIASSYPKLFNGVMKKLDVNIKLSEDSAENIVEREYNHFDFCICKEDEKKKQKRTQGEKEPVKGGFHFSLSCIGEGNGNPFQCSCLENPRDGGAW